MLKIVGDGELLGAATHVEVARAPGEEGSATITFALDAAGRAKRGINFGSWLTGPLPIKLKAPLTRANAEVEIDLTPAGVDNPVPGLSKPAGKPGKATFLVKPTPEGASLSNVAIDLGVPMLRGIGSNGRRRRRSRAPRSPRRASRPATISRSTSSMARLRSRFRCAALRSTPAPSSNRFWTGPRPDKPRRRISTSTPRSRPSSGSNKQAITNMELTASRRGGETRLGSLRGRIGGGAVTATGSGGETRITTSDAGALAPFRQSLFASRGRRPQSASPLSRRSERRRGDAHRLRPARRTGVSPAGQRRAAARVGRRSRRCRCGARALSRR